VNTKPKEKKELRLLTKMKNSWVFGLVADKVQAALVWYFTTLLPARPNVKKDS
jgi:hypothetical protein